MCYFYKRRPTNLCKSDKQTIHFKGCIALKHKLCSAEELRLAVAQWLLHNDKSLILCQGNELGKRFTDSYVLPELKEELAEKTVNGSNEIIFVLQSKITIPSDKSLNSKPCSFIILRYVSARFDDYGNIYAKTTLGYSY